MFPRGTVHLAVVDPGVGTARRPLVVERSDGQVLVGPDNGLLSWAAGSQALWYEWQRWDLLPRPLSRTFHARDLFGPACAFLACGKLAPQECGPKCAQPIMLQWPGYEAGEKFLRSEVLVVDRFGNLIVGIPGQLLPKGGRVVVEVGGSRMVGAVSVYESLEPLVVHEDSSGLVEISVPGGRADKVLGAAPGAEVTIRWD